MREFSTWNSHNCTNQKKGGKIKNEITQRVKNAEFQIGNFKMPQNAVISNAKNPGKFKQKFLFKWQKLQKFLILKTSKSAGTMKFPK